MYPNTGACSDRDAAHLDRFSESAGTISAGAGGLLLNQCRKPQRVSTKWQSVHLPDPETQRAISPCLQTQNPVGLVDRLDTLI